MDTTNAHAIGTHWYEQLISSVAVNDFCEGAFDTTPSLFLYHDPRDKEGRQDTPFIGVIPMADRDGQEVEMGRHVVMVVLGIEDKAEVQDDDGRGVRQRGGETMNQFETVVREFLAQLDYPLSSWEAELSVPGKGYFEKHIFITVNIPNTLGL